MRITYILGIISRETRAGKALYGGAYGADGHGYGLMQVIVVVGLVSIEFHHHHFILMCLISSLISYQYLAIIDPSHRFTLTLSVKFDLKSVFISYHSNKFFTIV